MISQEFRVCTLSAYTSSATYVLLPRTQLHIDYYAAESVIDLMLWGMGSGNKPSAPPRLSLVDEASGDFLESHVPDQALGEKAQERLLALRRQAAEMIASDDGSPYEWTDEGTADMREALRAVHGSQCRMIESRE